jgi:hypothetical protein
VRFRHWVRPAPHISCGGTISPADGMSNRCSLRDFAYFSAFYEDRLNDPLQLREALPSSADLRNTFVGATLLRCRRSA